MRILVTGATGFVGQRAVAALLARGHQVRAAVRRLDDGTRARLDPAAEPCAVGDIGPDTDWTAALAGVDAVLHLAARVHVMRDTVADPLAAFRHVNTAGTRRLAEMAAVAGARRLVFISSVKAAVDESQDAPLSAATADAPTSPYGVSKLEAERALAAVAAATGLETVVLRPPLVYGPGVAGNFRTLLRLAALGVPLPLAGVRNRRSLIFVDHLADAAATALDSPAAAGGTFYVHDGAPWSTPALVRQLAAGMGRPARLFYCPPALLALGAGLLGRRAAYDRVAGSLHVDDQPFRDATGWRPVLGAENALSATAAAFLLSSAKNYG